MALVPYVMSTDDGWFSVTLDLTIDRFISRPSRVTKTRAAFILEERRFRRTCVLASAAIHRCLGHVAALESGSVLDADAACEIGDFVGFLEYAVGEADFSGPARKASFLNWI